MVSRCSAAALTVALVTGFPPSASAEAENSTMAARSLRGAFSRDSCKSKNAQCGSNGQRTAECCSGLDCETMFGSFEMRCVDKPSPPTPAPFTVMDKCKDIGCGKSGVKCECIEECLLRGTCCSDFHDVCKSPAPQPTPAPFTVMEPVMEQGSYVSWNFDSSYCMSVDNNVFQNGQKMQLWKCSDGSGQKFQFDSSSSVLRPSEATEFCVVIDGNKNENGASIQLWECDLNVEAQQWIRQRVGDAQLLRNKAFPDKCLVVDSNKGANGQKLQIWSCDKASQQYQTWL